MIDFIKDADCTKETPVKLGVPDAPIYGKGIKLKPRVDGRTDSEHFKKIYLPELLPLEEYDLIVVLISGGKDSVACYLKLLELGVPKERIEFWHHDIDGGHPSRRMDWKCTQNYVKALADAEGIKLRVSYRVNGFFGELYRIGASEPIEWIDPDTGEVKQCKLSSNYLKCKELKEQATEEMEELLKKYGYRMKFPAKTGDLSRRWCSAYLKICVADTVVSNLDRLGELEELGGKRHKFPAKGGTHSGRWCSGNLKAAVQDSVTANLEETKRDKKILIVSGERRGESAGRSKYNEMEIHRTNAEAKAIHESELNQLKIDFAVEKALTGAKAKNIKAVKALLELGEAKLDKDGNVKGLDEQIEKLRSGDDTKFLFEAQKQQKQQQNFKGFQPGASGEQKPGEGEKVDFSKMSYDELTAYMEANPDAQI